jgi:hypothetical protein
MGEAVEVSNIARSRRVIGTSVPGGQPFPGRPRVRRLKLSAALIALVLALVAAPASADRYDSNSAGFPLRIVAYALHPVGVAIDYLIMRPAHWLVMREPAKTIFGHTD